MNYIAIKLLKIIEYQMLARMWRDEIFHTLLEGMQNAIASLQNNLSLSLKIKYAPLPYI